MRKLPADDRARDGRARLRRVALPRTATLYKWTDANGRVVYSDQPPHGATSSTKRWPGAPPPSNPNAVKEMAVKELEVKQAPDRRRGKGQESGDAAGRGHQARGAVPRARRRTSSSSRADPGRLVRYNEKGETVYVDDASAARSGPSSRRGFKQNCTGTRRRRLTRNPRVDASARSTEARCGARRNRSSSVLSRFA